MCYTQIVRSKRQKVQDAQYCEPENRIIIFLQRVCGQVSAIPGICHVQSTIFFYRCGAVQCSAECRVHHVNSSTNAKCTSLPNATQTLLMLERKIVTVMQLDFILIENDWPHLHQVIITCRDSDQVILLPVRTPRIRLLFQGTEIPRTRAEI